jgi:hypothetical protein
VSAHVIFKRDSGEVVHVHIEPDEVGTSREGLLAIVEPSHDPESLEIAVVDLEELKSGIADRIDPKTQKVMPADEGSIGFAGGWAEANQAPPPLPAHVRRTYEGKRRR